jgi:nitrile hydratase
MERRVHDRGGWPDGEPIDQAEHEYAMWEKQTDALMGVLRSKGLLRTDELRRAIESLAPAEYERLTYYQRWLTAITALLIEKGIVTPVEIEQKLRTWDAYSDH